tara:strand:+ start:366 stop:812 length:447 start_codon:yes stop_codon:yes gene_type:complete
MIKQLKPEIIEEFKALDSKVFDFSEKKEILLHRIKTFPKGCIGYYINNKLLSYITSELWVKHHIPRINTKGHHDEKGKILYITSTGVNPKHQNKGIGSKLLKNMIKRAKRMKLKSIYLRTHKAKKFYEKNGFSFVKRGKGYDIMELYI